MIINDKDAIARLASPMNLINQLRSSTNGNNGNKRSNAMSLFGIGRNNKTNEQDEQLIEEAKVAFNPFITKEESQTSLLPQLTPQLPIITPQQAPPSQPMLADILENHESQIKLGLAHDKALDLLHRSVVALAAKLDDVKADKLPAVISAASKTVESIRRERNEASKNNKDREVHYHFYTPEQKKISDYEVIDVVGV